MRERIASILVIALLGAGAGHSTCSVAQTPEQKSLYEAQRAQALVEKNALVERLEKERAARKADPMAWVRTLDPMSSGGWEFREVADDGAWATFTTNHQLKRSGKLVTAWLRQEFAEPQRDPNGDAYLSFVQKVEYDCGKERARASVVIYYSENNLKGNQQTMEVDPKSLAWSAIVPGTLDEANFLWACSTDRTKTAR